MSKRLCLVLIIIFCLLINNNSAEQKKKISKESSSSKKDTLSDCYVKGIIEFDKNNYSKAAEFFRKFLDKKPSCNKINIMIKEAFEKYQKIEINFIQGEQLYSSGHYEEAYPFFKAVLEMAPFHNKAITLLRNCYKEMRVKIRILDEPTSEGQEVKERIVSRDAELKLYAVAYDKDDNFLGPVKVRWITAGDLARISSYPMRDKLNFSPIRINKKGTVKAILFKGTVAETGVITTSAGKAITVKIFDVPDPVGNEVDSINLKAGEKITLYAHGFDKNNEYVGVVPIAWSVTGGIEKKYRRYFSSLNYFSKKAGKGRITVVTKHGKSRNISINIRPSNLYYLQIEDAPDGKGYEIFSLKLLTGKSYKFYSVGYDRYHNFIMNVKADWNTGPSLEPVNKNNSEEFIFKPVLSHVGGVIYAKKEGLIEDKTEPIYVYRGSVKMTRKQKMELVNRMAKEDKIIYFVKKDDILSKIVPRILYLPFIYEEYKPYIQAIAEYNRLESSDLLVWGQPLFLPYFKSDRNTTRSDLAMDLFGAEDKKEKIVIYNKKGADNITPDDKLIILDTDYLRTGDSAYLEVKYPR